LHVTAIDGIALMAFKVLGRQLAGNWGLIIAGIDVIAKIITHATTDDDIRVQLVGSFQVES
jgi:hypothetical protein